MDADAPPAAAAQLIDAFASEFSAAVDLLAGISDAPLFVCHAPDFRPTLDPTSRADCRAFRGGAFAGLPGRHIQALCPIGFGGGEVWHLGYQQAIAIGHLLMRGEPWRERMLLLGGDAIRQPRALMVPAGASIDALLAGETEDVPRQILDGSPVLGRACGPDRAFIGALQNQLTVTRAATHEGDRVVGTLVPGDWLEAHAPPGIHAVPLLRALQVGDIERARQLGALELVEEDLAPLSHACVSNADYGRLLRGVLDQLEQLG
jgi:Na+-transporting NADH:ubiquinone oxidoreductase subunit A